VRIRGQAGHQPMKKPTLAQRKEMHPPAQCSVHAVSRMKTLINRLRYVRTPYSDYNADIAELEILPYLRSTKKHGIP
jgi:hypothetical protein